MYRSDGFFKFTVTLVLPSLMLATMDLVPINLSNSMYQFLYSFCTNSNMHQSVHYFQTFPHVPSTNLSQTEKLGGLSGSDTLDSRLPSHNQRQFPMRTFLV